MRDDELRRLYAVVVARRTEPRGEHCPSPEALKGMAEGVGSESERLALLDHIGECAECQRDLELFRVAQARPAERWVLYTGVAAAAAVVLVAALLWRGRPTPSDPTRGNHDRIELVTPRGSVSGNRPPAFIWRSMPEAIGYSFELLDDRPVRTFHLMLPDTALVLPDSVALIAGRVYTWRVRPVLPSGEGPPSAFLSFTLQKP
jgi:hypothetical protein